MATTGVPADVSVRYFQGADGIKLAYREMGEGKPLVLIHGYFSTAFVNWVRYGHAAVIAARGRRVIMPDLRGHGDSAKPHDPGAYPPDVLADDGFALIDHLGLTDYDLGGYSLGSIEWMTEAFLKTVGADPAALLHILATFVDTPIEEVARIRTPTLVLVGADDNDDGSAEGLAAALPSGEYVSIPGNHMNAVTKPELGTAVANFLDGRGTS
jgi:pimeloyl-ACP methyl ester carboxylesterase